MLLPLHRARQSGRNLVVLGGLALILLGLTYLVMVRTDFGQTFGDSAHLGRLVESKSARETARGILNVLCLTRSANKKLRPIVFPWALHPRRVGVTPKAGFDEVDTDFEVTELKNILISTLEAATLNLFILIIFS